MDDYLYDFDKHRWKKKNIAKVVFFILLLMIGITGVLGLMVDIAQFLLDITIDTIEFLWGCVRDSLQK